jgi:hypothetical protein
MNIEDIQREALNFRNAIESCRQSLGDSFQCFPRGSCGDVVPLLGSYLNDQGYGEFLHISGDYCSHEENIWISHAWLQSNDFLVDITADQFFEINKKVIVTTESKWHNSLKGKPIHKANYRIYNSDTVFKLDNMYQIILKHISFTREAEPNVIKVSKFIDESKKM